MKIKHYLVGIVIIVLDQITKMLLIDKYITLIPNILNFTYTKNYGMAFGMGSGKIIVFINIIFILAIILYLIINRKKIHEFMPYFIILGGAIGNLFDRIFRGYVIDYIDVNLFNFPNFNIADICITLGIIYLIYTIVKEKYIKK